MKEKTIYNKAKKLNLDIQKDGSILSRNKKRKLVIRKSQGEVIFIAVEHITQKENDPFRGNPQSWIFETIKGAFGYMKSVE
ncbi:MAG: hypothetical protein HAW60_05950 [Bdellovibrionales bacterium]|nr:hypothetical protein [Bdellovibrionales bacterium]